MKQILAYTLTCFLKSGNKVTSMVSAQYVTRYRNNYITGGYIDATDIESGTIICVFKDAIDFVTFTPIYSKEETVGDSIPNDNSSIEESERSETPTDNCGSTEGQVP